MSKRHFWKKNPNKIPKIPFWEICKRPFWKKNPDFFPGYMVMNFKKIFFPGNELASFLENKSTDSNVWLQPYKIR